MCEGRHDDDPVVECSEFEDFPCEGDEDDAQVDTAPKAIAKFSAIGECWWDTAAGGFAVEYSASRGELTFDGTDHPVTASGATLSNTAGDSWTIFKDTVSGHYRVGDGGVSLRYAPASGTPKSRLALVT
jgi:hypothetical protein